MSPTPLDRQDQTHWPVVRFNVAWHAGAAFAVRTAALVLTCAVVLALTWSAEAVASIAPTTPTFLLTWGSLGSASGQFNLPGAVATDALGNVYVADQNNHRIEKFDFLGNYISQWGSLGSGNGEFNNPTGVAVDASGNVYVADFGNNRIQKFSSSGGYVTKWGSLGSGNGKFNSPFGVATDPAGNIYVSDEGNSRIQKFTNTGTYLAQWGSAGSGIGQFGQPIGIATDAAGNVYVAEFSNNRIQKFTGAGTYVTQWGSVGGGNGQFQAPVGVGTDAVGNVYVADRTNNRIQKFTGTGTYISQWGSAGSGTGQFAAPFGVAADAAGNLYVVDENNHRIQKFSGAGASGPATSALEHSLLLSWGSTGSGNGQFQAPAGVATDASGNVYVADRDNSRIQKFSSNGAFLTQWGGLQLSRPNGVATFGGIVYVTDTNNNRIMTFLDDGSYNSQWGSQGAGNGQFFIPLGVATDVFGSVYVADAGNGRIEKFDRDGAYLTQWGAHLGFGLTGPEFVAAGLDFEGNVYASVPINNLSIQKFTNTGTYLGPVALPGTYNPSAMVVDATGDIFFGGSSGSCGSSTCGFVLEITGTGVLLNGFGVGEIARPGGLARDRDGNFYVVDKSNNRVLKYAAAPRIELVSDVGNDQGDQVRLRILRSTADAASSGKPIVRYDVFRRIDALPAAGSTLAAIYRRAAPLETSSVGRPGVQLAGWEQVGSISAYGESEYNVVVPTLANANASSLYYSAFMVRAATADPYLYLDSGVEYGYSIDNLSPPAPSPFAAAYTGGATHLHWGVSTASDFATFRLYRGSSADFTPGSGNLVAATTDTGYADPGSAGSYYKLSAVDFNGNESGYAVVTPGGTVDVAADAGLALTLEGVRPNPTTSTSMAVSFVLPTAAQARLELVDVRGRMIAVRDVGLLGAGRHVVDLASGQKLRAGIYVVRLAQGGLHRTARAVVLD